MTKLVIRQSATATTPANPILDLPSWTDPGAVAGYVTSLLTFVIGLLGIFHLGVPASVSGNESSIGGAIALIVAGGVQAFNIFSHRAATATIAASAFAAGLVARK